MAYHRSDMLLHTHDTLARFVEDEARKLSRLHPVSFDIKFERGVKAPLKVDLDTRTESLFPPSGKRSKRSSNNSSRALRNGGGGQQLLSRKQLHRHPHKRSPSSEPRPGFSLKVVSAPTSDSNRQASSRRPTSSPAQTSSRHHRRRSSSPLVVIDAPPSSSSYGHGHGGHGHVHGHGRQPAPSTQNLRRKRHSARPAAPSSPYSSHSKSSGRRKATQYYGSHSRNGGGFPPAPQSSRSPSPQSTMSGGVYELSATSGGRNPATYGYTSSRSSNRMYSSAGGNGNDRRDSISLSLSDSSTMYGGGNGVGMMTVSSSGRNSLNQRRLRNISFNGIDPLGGNTPLINLDHVGGIRSSASPQSQPHPSAHHSHSHHHSHVLPPHSHSGAQHAHHGHAHAHTTLYDTSTVSSRSRSRGSDHSGTDMSLSSVDTRDTRLLSVVTNPFKTAAINGVLQIYHKRESAQHTMLQLSCIRTLDRRKNTLSEPGDFNSGGPEPLIDLCVIDHEKEKIPSGFEAVCSAKTKSPIYAFAGSGRKYAICFKRRRMVTKKDSKHNLYASPSTSLTSTRSIVADDQDLRPITDIHLISEKTTMVPGYTVLKTTYFGQKITQINSKTGKPGPMYLTFSRRGHAPIRNITVITPQNEKTPSGHILHKRCPRGKVANLNDGAPSSDAKLTYLAYQKDCSSYIVQNSDLLQRSDLKYLSPLLLACHVNEPVVATIAVQVLEPLILSGFMRCPESAELEKSCVTTVVRALCDAAENFSTRYHKKVFKLLIVILKQHKETISSDLLFEMMLAGNQIFDVRTRQRFLKDLMSVVLQWHESDQKLAQLAAEANIDELGDGAIETGNSPIARAVPVFGSDDGEDEPGAEHRHGAKANGGGAGARSRSAGIGTHDEANRSGRGRLDLSALANGLAGDVAAAASGSGDNRAPAATRSRGIARFNDYDDEEKQSFPPLKAFSVGDRSPPPSHHGTATPTTTEFVRNIVKNIAIHVHSAQISQDILVVYLTESMWSPQFRDAINRFLTSLFDDDTQQKTVTWVLVMCKLALGPLPSETHKSFSSPALQVLHQFIQQLAGSELTDLRESESFMFVLRRFLSIVITANLTGVSQASTSARSFEHTLSLFQLLWTNFPDRFKVELGMLLHHVVLPMLASQHVAISQKCDILDVLKEIPTPQNLADLFYNYDSTHTSDVFEHLVEVLANLVIISKPKALNDDGRKVIGAIEDVNTEVHDLHVKCLQTLGHLVSCMFKWAKFVTDRQAKTNRPASAPTASSSTNTSASSTPRGSPPPSFFSSPKLLRRSERSGTVAQRFGVHQTNKRLIEEAIFMANTHGADGPNGKSLRKAIQFLISSKYLTQNAQEIATFLHRYIDEFTIEEVGWYLGGSRPKEEKPFEEEIRVAFLERLHFQEPFRKLRLDRAMRILLTDSGFRLPGDANPIQRILESFAHVYLKISDEPFENEDAVYVSAYSILILNTNLHNPSLKPADRMTKAQFLNMATGIKGTPYAADGEWTDTYFSIQREAIEIKFEATEPAAAGGAAAAAAENGASSATNALSPSEENPAELRRLCRSWARRTLGELKDESVFFRQFYTATSIETSSAMHQVAHIACMQAFHAAIQTQDVAIVDHCLRGFSYLLQLSILLKRKRERTTIAQSLAEFTFMHLELSKSKKSKLVAKFGPKLMRSRVHLPEEIVNDGIHLDQDWLTDLSSLNPSKIAQASKLVIDTVAQAKARFAMSMNEAMLDTIQSMIVSEVLITGFNRQYIGEGKLEKLTADKSSRRLYHVFLFDDALMYCSGGSGKYKVHRVIQLAFCSLFDVGTTIFKLTNPQKVLTFSARSQAVKKEWMKRIYEAIKSAKAHRLQLISAASDLVKEGKLDKDVLERIKSTSFFVGKTPQTLAPTKKSSRQMAALADRCKLCWTKQSSSSMSKKLCAYCMDPNVCKNCCKSRVNVPNGPNSTRTVNMKHRVCEGCAGIVFPEANGSKGAR